MTAESPPPDPTTRFSDRVADYVRYRPSYPAEVMETLRQEAGLTAGMPVADIGSGTGIFSTLLLGAGAEVYAVEPNAAMRQAAESRLAPNPLFHSVTGSAEETTIAAKSVGLVTAAQAFHWFDVPRARAEFARILRAGGGVALLWNSRRERSTPFLAAYEALLHRYGTDYAQVNHRGIDARRLLEFFGGELEIRSFSNAQRLDWAGLGGRLLSSSYAPAPGHPDHLPMMAALERLFAEFSQDGQVAIEYDCQLFFGRLR